MVKWRWTVLFVVLINLMASVGCGSAVTSTPDVSETSFIPGSQATRAVLEARDLSDEFLFHVTVINAPSFHKDALTYGSAVELVQLKVDDQDSLAPVLRVLKRGESEPLMSFNAGFDTSGRLEVDFASPGNELSVGSSQVSAAIDVPGSRDRAWVATGQAVVRRVLQDQDTIIADVDHVASTVRQSSTGFVRGDRQGVVTIRIFLRRASQTPQLSGPTRTVGEGLAQNIGYFAADWRSILAANEDNAALSAAAEKASPIIRLPIPSDDVVTIYLKDFPGAYFDVAAQAVRSWNLGLGRDVLRVMAAPAEVDTGDPRYHVIKWLDDLDDTVQWAGVSKVIADPRTGAVLNTNILINGNFNISRYRAIHELTQMLADDVANLRSRIGNVPLLREKGEIPEIPFFTDIEAASFDDYMKGYYRETITHELGHSLGLRHNFAGSIERESATQMPASVMDYAPRPLRNRTQGPGFYDVAALQWGYFGTIPARKLPFCTDEDLGKDAFCNQGDDGDPFSYTTAATVRSLELVASQSISDGDSVLGTFGVLFGNLLKFKRLASQIPQSRRTEILSDIDATLNYVRQAEPAANLTDVDRSHVAKNLARIREVLQAVEQGG